jgi:hypothetical protein
VAALSRIINHDLLFIPMQTAPTNLSDARREKNRMRKHESFWELIQSHSSDGIPSLLLFVRQCPSDVFAHIRSEMTKLVGMQLLEAVANLRIGQIIE